MTLSKVAADLTEHDIVSLAGKVHVVAVNMTETGTVSCYLRPERRRTSASLCYRIPLDPADTVTVLTADELDPAAFARYARA